MNRAVDSYFRSGLAPSTNRTYVSGIQQYVAICEQLHTEPTPTSEQLLCRFCTILANKGSSHSTIKVYLSAVRQLHVQRSQCMPTISAMPRLCQVLQGIKIVQASTRGKAAQHQRLPVTPKILRRIKTAWENQGLDIDKIMLWAAFTICFFCFMRSGELGVSNDGTFDPSRDLTANDISVDDIRNPQVLKIRLKHSKTDPFREGTDIVVARTHDDLCPVTAMLAWIVLRSWPRDDPLFYFQSGAPLTRSNFVTHFKNALSIARIDPAGYSGHSFRIGAATTAARRGLQDSTIKQLGRWRSDAYQRYIKPSAESLAHVASYIAIAPESGPREVSWGQSSITGHTIPRTIHSLQPEQSS